MLYDRVVEIDERVTMEGATDDPDCDFHAIVETANLDPDLVQCASGDIVRILKRPGQSLPVIVFLRRMIFLLYS